MSHLPFWSACCVSTPVCISHSHTHLPADPPYFKWSTVPWASRPQWARPGEHWVQGVVLCWAMSVCNWLGGNGKFPSWQERDLEENQRLEGWDCCSGGSGAIMRVPWDHRGVWAPLNVWSKSASAKCTVWTRSWWSLLKDTSMCLV